MFENYTIFFSRYAKDSATIRSLIEGDENLAYIAVSGEISNFKSHFQSGHWYFTLKDKDASVRCVMFKASNQKIKFLPKDGEAVILLGRVSLYEKDGRLRGVRQGCQRDL